MRKYIIIAALLLVVAGGAYYALLVEPTRQFKAGLDQALQSLSPGYSGTYQDAQYSYLKHSATVTGLTIHANAASAANDYAFESISIVNPNTAFSSDWQRARSNPAAFAQDQALPIADRIEIKGFSAKAAIGNATIRSFSIDKPRVFAWALLHPGLPAWDQIGQIYTDAMQAQMTLAEEQKKAAEQSKPNEDGKPAEDTQTTDSDQPAEADPAQSLAKMQEMERRQLEALMPIARMEAAILMGIGIDAADMDGVDYSLHHPASESLPAGDWHITLQKAHEGVFERGVLSTASLEGIAEDIAPVGKFTAQHVVEERVSFRDPAMRLLNGDAPSMAMLNGLSLGHGEIDGIGIVAPTGKTTEIHAISFSDVAFNHSFLSSATFSLDGAKIQKDMVPDPTGQQFFQQFGLDAVTVSFGLSYKWVEEKSLARIQNLSLKVDELGALKVVADISGIARDKPETESTLALAGALVRYDNVSLVERLSGTNGMPQQQGAQVRAKTVQAFLDGAGLQANASLTPSINAIMRFARQPHSLTITVVPPAPVPLSTLKDLAPQGPAALFAALGLSVLANQ